MWPKITCSQISLTSDLLAWHLLPLSLPLMCYCVTKMSHHLPNTYKTRYYFISRYVYYCEKLFSLLLCAVHGFKFWCTVHFYLYYWKFKSPSLIWRLILSSLMNHKFSWDRKWCFSETVFRYFRYGNVFFLFQWLLLNCIVTCYQIFFDLWCHWM